MSAPKRHDIYEDENGTRVAVCKIFLQNALGVSYVEFKNLSDSNLRFLPQAEFLENFKWVDNFDSTDTNAKLLAEVGGGDLPNSDQDQKEAANSGESSSGSSVETEKGQAEEMRAAKPSKTE
jgi:hypothetical protein